MTEGTAYAAVWLLYLASSLVFFLVWWKFTGLLGRIPAWLLRVFMAALIWTPAWPQDAGEVAVPALMALALDTIASGPAAAARGLVALAMGMVLALSAAVLVFLLWTFGGGRLRRSRHPGTIAKPRLRGQRC